MTGQRSALVSVVIPCYGCAETLDRALASVAAQTRRPVEIILVCDGQLPQDQEAVKRAQNRLGADWIRVFGTAENLGAGAARNLGWEQATQPWIAFLDADDAWHPRKLEIQLAFLDANPEVVLCGHGWKLLVPGQHPDWAVGDAPGRRLPKWMMLLSNRLVTPSVMIRRDVPWRFMHGQRFAEDHMLWMSAACAGAAVYKLPQALAALYKPFGARGLSSHLLRMQRGDMGNYRRLYAARQINAVAYGFLMLISAAKFLRRSLMHAWTALRS